MDTKPLRPVKLIGVASNRGALNSGTADGPRLLRELHVFRNGASPPTWDGTLKPNKAIASPVEAVSELSARIAWRVRTELDAGHFPLVIGGDHSCAIGTWSGVHRWLGRPLGLIWLDAHMDSHTFATSSSGALHGMPLASLLGYGEPELTHLVEDAPKLRPEHICLLGVRSYEEGEAALLKKLGVRVISMGEMRSMGIAEALKQAMDVARQGTAGFGVSLDLDVLDPAEEPGVSTPVPGGLSLHELEAALHQLHNDPALLAMEIVEYDPRRDRDHLTAMAAGALYRAVMEE